jgi:hypothetical protein
MEGLEPPYLTASDPKSDVSTNFTTSGEKLLAKSSWLIASFGAANVGHFPFPAGMKSDFRFS